MKNDDDYIIAVGPPMDLTPEQQKRFDAIAEHNTRLVNEMIQNKDSMALDALFRPLDADLSKAIVDNWNQRKTPLSQHLKSWLRTAKRWIRAWWFGPVDYDDDFADLYR